MISASLGIFTRVLRLAALSKSSSVPPLLFEERGLGGEV
jgi:hypothetical protein